MPQPPPGPNPELQAPPSLNSGQLWLSLLLPMGLTALSMGLGWGAQAVANFGMLVVLLAGIACWVLFAKCISRRYIGNTRVILIVLYPFIQAALVFVTFFAGCLIMIGNGGFY